MSHDEFRVLNQDEACLKVGKTPGELLADNARSAQAAGGDDGLYVERHV